MSQAILSTLTENAPPASFSAPLQALWWIKKGGLQLGPEWEQAHEICQSSEGVTAYDWIHALLHLIEEDESNANYWYRRAGKVQGPGTVADEWERIAAELGETL